MARTKSTKTTKSTKSTKSTKTTKKKPTIIKVEDRSGVKEVKVNVVPHTLTINEALIELYRMDKADVVKVYATLRKVWRAEKRQERYENRASNASNKLIKLLRGEK